MRKEITTLIENEFVELPSWKISNVYDKSSFIMRTQEEGEKELVRISRTAGREDCWTYLKEREIWVHPATEYSTEFVKDGSTLHRIKSSSLDFMEEIVDLDKQINYHTHPWKIFSETYKSLSTRNQKLKLLLGNLFCSWLALPSGFDLKQTLLYPGERKIASPFGITSYRLYSGNPPGRLYSNDISARVHAETLIKKGCGRYINFLIEEIKSKLPDVHFDLKFERVRIRQ